MINVNIPVILEDLAMLNMLDHQGIKIVAPSILLLKSFHVLWKGPLERNLLYAQLRIQVGAVQRKSGNVWTAIR